MDQDQLLAQVRALHAKGLSANAITRTLGVPRARVAPLVRELARGPSAAAAEPAIVGSWVSSGWSAGLIVPARRGWPDLREHGIEGSGLVGVVVARQHRRLRGSVTVCGYLVDTYCLGVKDALGPRPISRTGLGQFLTRFFEPFDGGPLEAPDDLVSHLVWGAVAHARRLGFAPNTDFAPTARHLPSLDGPSDITFGLRGKPTYVQGPFDDADRILRTLDTNVGLDNVHFTVTASLESA
jgi:hypothetical protein